MFWRSPRAQQQQQHDAAAAATEERYNVASISGVGMPLSGATGNDAALITTQEAIYQNLDPYEPIASAILVSADHTEVRICLQSWVKGSSDICHVHLVFQD